MRAGPRACPVLVCGGKTNANLGFHKKGLKMKRSRPGKAPDDYYKCQFNEPGKEYQPFTRFDNTQLPPKKASPSPTNAMPFAR